MSKLKFTLAYSADCCRALITDATGRCVDVIEAATAKKAIALAKKAGAVHGVYLICFQGGCETNDRVTGHLRIICRK